MPVRMALMKRSAGNRRAGRGAGRHHFNATMVPRLLTALTQNGTPMCAAAVSTPANAGPIARLILTPTLFAATAEGNSSRGTSCGTMDCHAGAVTAAKTSTRKVNSSKVGGVIRSRPTSAANTVATIMIVVSARSKRRRLSTMSASAPAGSANRNIGRLVATCTSDTMRGSASRVVISHPAAELYIHVPTLAATVADQITAYVLCRNGLKGELVVGEDVRSIM